MGRIVGGFLVPHDPLMFAAGEAISAERRDGVFAAYAEASRRLEELRPDAVVIFGTDHYILFGPGCLPQALVAIGELDGPIDRMPGLDRRVIPHHPGLAEHILRHVLANDFDLACAKVLTVDHSVAIPQQLIVAPVRDDLPVIPFYLACGVDPVIPMRRAATLGRLLRQAVEAWPGDERVVVIGSGGISHSVGEADMGRINSDFDRMVLDHAERGDVEGLCAMPDEQVLREGGNGALEIRNFVAAMSAVPGARGEVIAYHPVPEWITGLGFVQVLATEQPAGERAEELAEVPA
jgi:protocatechuate 4,5-dioxygenase beta chain